MVSSPPLKRARFSREPDLEVEVEDEIVKVHSATLMAASDVFASMLESDMTEGLTGRIKLPGKKRADFELLLKHVDLRGGAASPKIEKESVEVLLRLADEYEMGGLKERCEGFLQSYRFSDEEFVLKLSLEFGFTGLAQTCAKRLACRLYKNRDVISKFVEEPVMMQAVLPEITKIFDLQVDECNSLPKALLEVVFKLIEKKRYSSLLVLGDFQRWFYTERAKALMQKLGGLIPALKIDDPFCSGVFDYYTEHDYDKMVTLDHLKRKCTEASGAGERFDAHEVEAILAHLEQTHLVFRSEKTKKYYRKRSEEVFGDTFRSLLAEIR